MKYPFKAFVSKALHKLRIFDFLFLNNIIKRNYIIKFFSFCLVAMSMMSCKEEEIIDPGFYSGIFTYEKAEIKHEAYTELTLEGGRYSSLSHEDHYPAGGSGTYTVNGASISFSDENVWTADFNWGLILNGNYGYKRRGNNLTIVRINRDGAMYKYKLIKH